MNPSSCRSRSPRPRLAIPALAALTLLAALLFAGSAQAAGYTTGTPLTTGKLTTSVAVNQSSRDLYAASAGGIAGGFSEAGLFQRFDSSGSEIACALGGSPEHPSSVAVNPENGHLYVIAMANSGFSTETELLTYDEACGAKLALVEATGDLTESMNEVTNVSAPSSGAFAVGQFLTGPMIPAFTTITECLPSCAGATTLKLSAAVEAGGTAVGASISATAFNLVAKSTFPIPQPATDSQGNIYYGDPTVNNSSTVKKYAPNGEEIAFEHPISGGLTRPASVARDSVGNIYVAAGAKSCSSTLANGRLRVYKPNGEFVKNFPSEGSPLTEVTTVAVDKSTNEVFVGRGCHETFRVEKHSAGGAKLDRIRQQPVHRHRRHATMAPTTSSRSTKRTARSTPPTRDAGKVQVFNAPAKEALTLTINGTGSGRVRARRKRDRRGMRLRIRRRHQGGPASHSRRRQGTTFEGMGGRMLGVGLLPGRNDRAAKSVTADFASRYTTGTPLTTGKLTTSVAVNQSSRDLYAASAGRHRRVASRKPASSNASTPPAPKSPGALGGSPEHPSSVAVNPENGHLVRDRDGELGLLHGNRTADLRRSLRRQTGARRSHGGPDRRHERSHQRQRPLQRRLRRRPVPHRADDPGLHDDHRMPAILRGRDRR